MTIPVRPLSRDAATLVIFRDSEAGVADILMLQRSHRMRFAGGAAVFPGGALDPADHGLAARFDHGLDPLEAACRIAAIRETVEESGVAIGLPGLDAEALATLRTALAAGADFGAELQGRGITPDLEALTPFARWLPDHPELTVFDTRFYLARMPDGAPEPTVDATENVHLFWASAQGVLDLADRGEARVIFPTRRNLERLALFDGHDAARAHALSVPVEIVTPWEEERDGGRWLCIPDHLGYPICAQQLTDVQRG